MPKTNPSAPACLTLTNATFRNLKSVSVQIPLARLVLVAGPSGAGKSSLFRNLLVPAVTHAIKHRLPKLSGKTFAKQTAFDTGSSTPPPAAPPPHSGAKRPLLASRYSLVATPTAAPLPPFGTLTNAHQFKSVIEVDQSPIGKTPRSTPATYLGIFDTIRTLFSTLPEAKLRGFTPGRFSFNTPGGRCETCAGAGRIKLEMAFMPETYVTCDACNGSRYNPDLLDITWNNKSIADILNLTFEEAADFFHFHNSLSKTCRLMCDCGLDYLTLGQSSPTLSGGEAQRLKLITELARAHTERPNPKNPNPPKNLYLLEEPTIGLHLHDCERLIHLLQSLVDQGHTVIVIEHHLDLLAEADYIIELGPTGGPEGGHLIYQGPLGGLLKTKQSPTAPYLKKHLQKSSLKKAASKK